MQLPNPICQLTNKYQIPTHQPGWAAPAEASTVDVGAITALLVAAQQTQGAPETVSQTDADAPATGPEMSEAQVEMMLAYAQQATVVPLSTAKVTPTPYPIDVLGDAPIVVSATKAETLVTFTQPIMPDQIGEAAAAIPPAGEPQIKPTTLLAAPSAPPHFDMRPYPTTQVELIGPDGKLPASIALPKEAAAVPLQGTSNQTSLSISTDAAPIEVPEVETPDTLQMQKPHSMSNVLDKALQHVGPAAQPTTDAAQQPVSPATNTAAPEQSVVVSALTATPAQTAGRKNDPLRLTLGTTPPEAITAGDGIEVLAKPVEAQSAITRSSARASTTLPHDIAAKLATDPDHRPSGEAAPMATPPAANSASGTPATTAAPTQGPMQQSAMAGVMLDVRRQGWTKTLVNRAAQSVQAGGTLTLSILPQHLGQITLKLSEGRKGMDLRITAEVASTASMLRGVETQISGAFDEAGLTLASFSAKTGGQGQNGDTPNERRDTTGMAMPAPATDEAEQPAADPSSLISIIA